MLNKAFLIGRLGKDVDLRYTPAGTAVATFSIATTETYTKQNEKHEDTQWHNIVAWGAKGEAASKYLSKGSLVSVVGKIKHRSYDDRDGNKKYITEIHADELTFLSKGGGDSQANNSGQADNSGAAEPPFNSDDIPF
jgi:single-strand DNA-binding protein